MFSFLYNLFFNLLRVLLPIINILGKKYRQWYSSQKEAINILRSNKERLHGSIWMHCASLGEFDQGKPVIENLKKKLNKPVLVSFFSPSGFQIEHDDNLIDQVILLPLDTRSNMDKICSIINPHCLILVRSEIWFNQLNVIQKRRIPAFLIAAIFSNNNFFFKKYSKDVLSRISEMNHIYTQDLNSLKIAKKNGLENVSVGGNTRVDSVINNSIDEIVLDEIEHFKGNKKLIIGGSTYRKEEDVFFNSIKLFEGNLKIILAPHHFPSQQYYKKKYKNFNFTFLSEYDKSKNHDILIIDKMGVLKYMYRYADVVYVGGGFEKEQIHNTLEPTVFGMPIIVGPNHKGYPEVKEFIKLKIAREVNDLDEIYKAISFWISNQEEFKYAQLACKKYFEDNKGADLLVSNGILEKL